MLAQQLPLKSLEKLKRGGSAEKNKRKRKKIVDKIIGEGNFTRDAVDVYSAFYTLVSDLFKEQEGRGV